MTDENPIPNPHDAAFKAIFRRKRVAESFFRRHLPEEIGRNIDFNRLKVVNKSYVDEDHRSSHADMVYRTTFAGRDAILYLLFEHQSTPEFLMVFRLLCYMVSIWREYVADHPNTRTLPVILPLVLYHGQRAWTAPLRFSELMDAGPEFKVYIPEFSYRLYDLGDYSDEILMSNEMAAVGLVLRVMKHIFDDGFWAAWRDSLRHPEVRADRELRLLLLEWSLRYACNARDDDDGIIREQIAQVMDDLGDDERARRVVMTIADRFREEGLKKGLEKGLIQGRVEGRIEGRSGIITRLLKKRFGGLTPVIEGRLRHSRIDILDEFGEAIFEFKDLRDAEKWWEEREKRGNA